MMLAVRGKTYKRQVLIRYYRNLITLMCTPLFIQLTGVMAVLIAELGIDCLAPLVKGFTDVSSQLEGFMYTNLQLFPVVITPLLIVWDILFSD